MDKKEIEEFTFNILANATRKDKNSISKEMHLENDFGIDSIAMASLVTKLEPLIAEKLQSASFIQSLLAAETVDELITIIHQNH